MMQEAADQFFRLLGMYPEQSTRHKFIYSSRPRAFRRYLGVSSDIYALHLEIGPLSVMWDSRELQERSRNARSLRTARPGIRPGHLGTESVSLAAARCGG